MMRLVLAVSVLAAFAACDKSDSPAGEAAEKNEAAQAETAAPEATAKVAAGAAKADDDELTDAEEIACAKAGAETGTCAEAANGGCNKWDEEAAEVAKREAPEDAEWTIYEVDGMTCGGCERRVIANLGGIDGVLAVEADAELGQVRVAYAKGADEIASTAAEKINALGYRVR